MAIFKYISNITIDDLNENIVIPCIDEEGYSCILIKNSSKKTIQNTYNTDNLEIKLNRVLDRKDSQYYVHIIKAKKIDSYSKKQFDTIFEYVFKKITNPESDVELAELVVSLEDYFKTTPEKDKTKIQIGMFGELFCFKYMYLHGYPEIMHKFHTNFYSKHDVEFSKKIRMEIKTTDTEKRIHLFKHNQICRNDVDVYVCSVMLERSKYGTTLYDLFNQIKEMCDNPDINFSLDALMIKCGVSEEDKGLSFSEEHASSYIKFMSSLDLPHLDNLYCNIKGVTNISYEVDCELANEISIDDLISKINLENK